MFIEASRNLSTVFVTVCNSEMSLTVDLFFFFSSRRRHTRSLRDWSSDVCSSDLPDRHLRAIDEAGLGRSALDLSLSPAGSLRGARPGEEFQTYLRGGSFARKYREIGRASCRERV